MQEYDAIIAEGTKRLQAALRQYAGRVQTWYQQGGGQIAATLGERPDGENWWPLHPPANYGCWESVPYQHQHRFLWELCRNQPILKI